MQPFAPNASELSLKVPFFKAEKTVPKGNCVEMARMDDGNIAVRDSKNPTGPALIFNTAEIDAWLDGAKKGEFDGLLA